MNDLYQTPDTRIATALVASGFTIEMMEKDKHRVIFYFKREGSMLDHVISRYWMKTLPIDAQTLLIENQIIKQRIANL